MCSVAVRDRSRFSHHEGHEDQAVNPSLPLFPLPLRRQGFSSFSPLGEKVGMRGMDHCHFRGSPNRPSPRPSPLRGEGVWLLLPLGGEGWDEGVWTTAISEALRIAPHPGPLPGGRGGDSLVFPPFRGARFRDRNYCRLPLTIPARACATPEPSRSTSCSK